MIHSQTLKILEKIGVAVKSAKASKLLVESDAEIHKGRETVMIPAQSALRPELVRRLSS